MEEEIKEGDIYCYVGNNSEFHTLNKHYTIIDPTPDNWGVIKITCNKGKYEYKMPLEMLKVRFVKINKPSFFIKELFDLIK